MNANSKFLLENIQGSFEDRIQAVFSLIHDKTQESFGSLEFCLINDPIPIARHEAAFALGEKFDCRSFPILIKTLRYDKNKFNINESALTFSNLGEFCLQEGKEIIKSLLNHKDDGIVDTAEIAVQRLEMKAMKEPFVLDPKIVIADLSKENREKRIQASFKLLKNASEDAIDTLFEVLHS